MFTSNGRENTERFANGKPSNKRIDAISAVNSAAILKRVASSTGNESPNPAKSGRQRSEERVLGLSPERKKHHPKLRKQWESFDDPAFFPQGVRAVSEEFRLPIALPWHAVAQIEAQSEVVLKDVRRGVQIYQVIDRFIFHADELYEEIAKFHLAQGVVDVERATVRAIIWILLASKAGERFHIADTYLPDYSYENAWITSHTLYAR